MKDMSDQNDKPPREAWKTALKVALVIIVVVVGMFVVAFGLLVGVCAFGMRG